MKTTEVISNDPVLEAARLIKVGIAVNEDESRYQMEWDDPLVGTAFRVNVSVDFGKTTTVLSAIELAENNARFIAEKLLAVAKYAMPWRDWYVSDDPGWYDEDGELIAVNETDTGHEDVLAKVDCVQYVITYEE